MRLYRIMVAGGLALFASPAFAQSAVPERVSLEAFATPPTASMARLSPDGTKIAAVRTGPGSDFIYIVTTADPGKVVRKIEIGRYSLADLVWANNDRLLLHPYWSVSVFGISIGGVWREIEGTLAELPSERTTTSETGPTEGDELAARRAARGA